MAPYYNPDQVDDTVTLPSMDPPSWQNANDHSGYNQDRYRLGRELARDFEDTSFASVAPPGEDSTAALLDIGEDANATSTKRIRPHVPTRAPSGAPGTMLYQTPTIDSRLMHDNFMDFTMAAEGLHDLDGDSYEVGRGRNGASGGSFMETTDQFSIGDTGAKKNESKKRTGGRIDDNQRGNSDFQDAAEARQRMDRDRRARVQAQDKSLGSPMPRSSPFQGLNFSPPAATPKRVTSRLSSGSGDRHSKIKDYVSNSGSGGSRASRFVNPPSNSEEDALSDIASATGRHRPANTRFHRNGNTANLTAKRPQDEDLTEDVPAILGRTRKSSSANAIPKSFKSTPDFLKELGLNGHTQTINLQQTLKELKDVGAPARPRVKQTAARHLNPEPSFMIPNIPDMTDLFSGNEPTRFSVKRGAAKPHHPIDSIPIPHETRAMLTAMKLLQEKVANLEVSKAVNEQQCAKLESELKKVELKYQLETRKARLAEEQIRRGRPDSTFGGSEDCDLEQQERAKSNWIVEKLTLESTISTLRGDLNQIRHELQTAKIALRNMQEERNSAINAVALAIASNEDLKAANHELHGRLEKMEHEKQKAEKRIIRQREEYRARGERFRQRANCVQQAAVIAGRAKAEAAGEAREAAERHAAIKHHEEMEREREEMELLIRERAREEREEQRRLEIKREFDQQVEEELRRIRPDLFVDRAEPTAGPRTKTVEVGGSQRVIAVPKSRRSRVLPFGATLEMGIAPEPNGKERAHLATPGPAGPEASVSGPGDSTMSISPDEIRRIAKEINAERKKRKAAAAAEKARQEEARKSETHQQKGAGGIQQEPAAKLKAETAVQSTAAAEPLPPAEPKKKGRRVVKVVYMLDGDTTEIRGLEKEIEEENQNAVNQPVPQPENAPDPPVVSQVAWERVVVPEVQLPSKDPEVAPAVQEEATGSGPQAETAPSSGPRVTFSTPPPPLPVNLHPLIDHANEIHDPQQCTVCVRYDELRRREEEAERENPLKDIDNSCLFPAPELEPASQRPASDGQFEEEPTLRPSVSPKTQLERVVRQLTDEFRHLKLMYSHRSAEFIELDPAIQKKRRKALTREMNELVAEMDAKSDQIYALYDVNEEFVDRAKQGEFGVGEETEDLIRSLEV